MFCVLVYDIDQSDGGRRLHKVAKICEGYGIRVQNSVFEMTLNQGDVIALKQELMRVIDVNVDSIRIYKVGKEKNAVPIILGHVEKVELTMQDGFVF